MTTELLTKRPTGDLLVQEFSATPLPNKINIIGFEFDGTACYRKGARLAPDAIRNAFDSLETYSPYLYADIEDGIDAVDLGNVVLPDHEDGDDEHTTVCKQWSQGTHVIQGMFNQGRLIEGNMKTLVIGGDHSISYAPLPVYLEQYPDLVVLHLDAHADLRDGYEGYTFSHAAVMRRTHELFGLGHELIQYGIRSGTREEFQWMAAHNTRRISLSSLLTALDALPNNRPIYLTLDVDYFDPSFVAGTGTPEAGGEDFHSFVSICKILHRKNFVGCDVVELAPEIDPTGNSDVFVAKVIRELLLCLGAKA